MVWYLTTAIRIQAFRMARSGDFVDCRSIESELDRSEHGRARVALADQVIRCHIDRLCRQTKLSVSKAGEGLPDGEEAVFIAKAREEQNCAVFADSLNFKA